MQTVNGKINLGSPLICVFTVQSDISEISQGGSDINLFTHWSFHLLVATWYTCTVHSSVSLTVHVMKYYFLGR